MATPIVSNSRLFIPQSYYDNTLMQKAILTQALTEQIVRSTEQELQQVGFAVGLHPTSETPISIRFIGLDGAQSGTIVLVPGQIVRPFGGNGFRGYKYGLPFGWLGGGLAHLSVALAPTAEFHWPTTSNEVVFHRQRIKIVNALPGSVTKNWPIRFPWVNAVRDANSIPQQGQPIVTIKECTKVLLRLRFQTSVAATVYKARIVWRGTQNFDLDSTGTSTATDFSYFDVIFDNDNSGLVGNYYQVMELNGPLTRIGADDGGIDIIDLTAGGALTNQYVDIERWGRL